MHEELAALVRRGRKQDPLSVVMVEIFPSMWLCSGGKIGWFLTQLGKSRLRAK